MPEILETTCCIVGGGPAGVMLGYLLARAGVAVTVLEKHKDFFRDFRGDTVHPSTLEVLHELDILDDFLELPHQKLAAIGAVVGDFAFRAADFRHVPAHCGFVAFMPQWDFLNFLSEKARRQSAFTLKMEHEATGLLRDSHRVTGVRVRTPQGEAEIRADLVVGCDGRNSITRSAAELGVRDVGAPIDVLWFRISRNAADPKAALGNVNYGRALILIDRNEYFQAGLIVPKGSFESIKRDGLDALRESIGKIAPFLAGRLHELQDWDQIKLLSVQINRLLVWSRPGLLCIGDAAHAMSPAGGVGINLAIQDAVATANLLARPLLERRVTAALLAQVQRRREFPTRVTQRLQVNAHRGFEYVFRHPGPLKAPWQLKAALRVPGVQRLAGRLVGMGIRPEHIRNAQNQGVRLKRVAECVGAALAAVVIFKRSWNRRKLA